MPPRIRKKDKHSAQAGMQFSRAAAADLAAATARRAQALHRAGQIAASPVEVLDALADYTDGQAAVDEALARLYGGLRLAGVSVYGLAQASRCRTATVTARVQANPTARLWAQARCVDLEHGPAGWVAHPRNRATAGDSAAIQRSIGLG